MKDWIFFPLALLVAAGFVLIAVNPTAQRAPSGAVSGGGRNAEDVTVRGDELHRFVTGDVGDFGGLSFEKADGETILQITRLAEQKYESPRSGPHLELAPDLELAFSSRPIEVIVEARSAGDFAATEFEINYMARPGEGGESGWKTFTLTRDFAPYAVQWTTPTRNKAEGEGYDFIGVRPVAPDKRRTMEVKSVRIRATGKKSIVIRPTE